MSVDMLDVGKSGRAQGLKCITCGLDARLTRAVSPR